MEEVQLCGHMVSRVVVAVMGLMYRLKESITIKPGSRLRSFIGGRVVGINAPLGTDGAREPMHRK